MSISYDAAHQAIRFADSYTRLGSVMELYCDMEPLDWWRLLGDQWSTCDNIARYRLILGRGWRAADRALLDAMMTPNELRLHATMPATLIVYRGCYEVNKVGLSWTLDRRIAERFPTLQRYRRNGDTPLLLTGRVRRDRAVLKMDRGEQEIISPSVRRIAIEPIASK